MEWHYVPQNLTLGEPNGSPPGIPLYRDHYYNGVTYVAFVPNTKGEVTTVLNYLGLRAYSAVWKTEDGIKICTAASPLKSPKPAKSQSGEEILELYGRAREDPGREERIRANLEEQRGRAKEYLTYLTNEYEQIHKLTAQLEELRNGDGKERWQQELTAIKQLAKVDSLAMQGANLIIRTKPLHSAVGVEFGKFTITIDVPRGTVEKIMNDNPVRLDHYDGMTYQHPHVIDPAGEHICWGNVVGQVAELQATRDIVALIAFTIDWMESFHPDRGGRYVKAHQAFAERNKE